MTLNIPPIRTISRARIAMLLALIMSITAIPLIGASSVAAGRSDADLLVLAEPGGRFSILATPSTGANRGLAAFGNPGDQPLMGDWDCDGVASPGVYRTDGGQVFLSNSTNGGRTDVTFYLGNPGDIALAGDYNGDGCDTIAVYRPGSSIFYVGNSLRSRAAVRTFGFGNPGDQPFVGDFNGNGKDTFGVARSNGWVFIGNDLSASIAPISYTYGHPGDQILAGDWNGDGTSTIAAYRRSTGSVYFGYAEPSVHVGQIDSAIAAPADATASAPQPRNTSTTASSWDVDVDVWPGDDLRSIAQNAAADTVFRINGVHAGQSIEPKDGQVFVGATGAVLRGDGAPYAFRGDAKNVVVEGLEITGYQSEPQKGAIHASGFGWVIRRNEIHHNATVGIKYSHADRATIASNNIHHNGQLGIGVGYSTGTLVENNTIAFNNWQVAFSWGWEAGGTKFWKTVDLTVRGNHSHDNHGPGLWDDKNNYNIVYEDNLVEDNYANGIFHEIGYKATIRNNVIRRNGFGHDSWLWGAGVLIASSQDTEVYGNTIEGNYNGITMTQQNRGEGDRGPYVVQNNRVHHNRIISSGITGVARDTDSDAIYSSNNTFDSNEYVGTNKLKWKDGHLSWSEWLAIHPDDGV
jgi:parallel beta-helix repeat protein